MLTIALVLLSPNIKSQSIKAKNRRIMHATEAGNDTELSDMRESTAKQNSKVIMIPIGTRNQAVKLFRHDIRKTWCDDELDLNDL